jgi:hypothetical protein
MGNRYLLTLGLAACLALAGCASSTALEVRQLGPENRRSFTVEDNYQPVYRQVLTQARKCLQMSMLSNAQMVVTGDLYSDIREGTVTVALHALTGVKTYLVVDIKALGEKQSQVNAYTDGWSASDAGTMIKEWVLENRTECGLKKSGNA